MHDAQRWMVLGALAAALAGCGGEDDGDRARDLYDLSVAGDQYKEWARFPGGDALYESAQHRGDWVLSYLNEEAAAAVADWPGEFPDGSILVKEQYADEAGATLNGHTVMWKISGYDPEHGDWFWAAFGPSGETTKQGKDEYCWGCHQQSASAADWVVTAFPR